MKKLELTLVFVLILSSNLFANDDDISKGIASVLGSAFVYGIIVLVRAIKNKKSQQISESENSDKPTKVVSHSNNDHKPTKEVSNKNIMTKELLVTAFNMHIEDSFPQLKNNIKIKINNDDIVFFLKNGLEDLDFVMFLEAGIKIKEAVRNCKNAGVKKLVFIDEIQKGFTDITIEQLEKEQV